MGCVTARSASLGPMCNNPTQPRRNLVHRSTTVATLPSGTVTFLFTDVEGSTRLWQADPAAMQLAIDRHLALLSSAVNDVGGVHFKTIGDAIQAAFPTADAALAAVVAAQRSLTASDWGDLGSLQVRMALHAGSATPIAGDYLAPCLNRLSRLL